MADWIGKSCIEGIFSLARDVTTCSLILSFFRKIRKKTWPSRYVNNIGKFAVEKIWKLVFFWGQVYVDAFQVLNSKDNKDLDYTQCERSSPPSLTMGEKPL